MKGLWIVGTDTDIGKTYVTGSILRWLQENNTRPLPVKPVQTGDVSDVAAALSIGNISPPDDVRPYLAPYHFRDPCSPHLAASREGKKISIPHIIDCIQALQRMGYFPIIEGTGGLLVPLDDQKTFLDLMKALPLPTILVARGALGTINHTLLSLHMLRQAAIPIMGVIINDSHPASGYIRDDNPLTISRLGNVPILADIRYGQSFTSSHQWKSQIERYFN